MIRVTLIVAAVLSCTLFIGCQSSEVRDTHLISPGDETALLSKAKGREGLAPPRPGLVPMPVDLTGPRFRNWPGRR